MKIAIIHYSCPPIIGGVETVIEAHAKLLAEHNYKVKVIVGRGNKFDKRVKVKTIPALGSMGKKNIRINEELDKGIISKNFNKQSKFIYKKLKKELKKSKIAIIHNILTMHFNMPLVVALNRIIKEKTKIKFIAWCHDATFNDPVYHKKKKKAFPFNLIAKKTERVKYAAVSNTRQKQIAKLFNIDKGKIDVVPNGVDMHNLLNLNPITSYMFRELNFFKDDITILLPTRIVRRKNIELAIKTTKELKKFKNIKMIITSQPDPHNKDSMIYYKHLKDIVKKNKVEDEVVFLYELKKDGKRVHISNNIMRDLFLLCDMLFFPSKQEGFGIPLLEAGIFNLPIVCSGIEPLREVGEDDVLYIDINEEPKKIAEKIINYYESHITSNMFKKVIKNYVWESIFERKIEPLIKSVS